MSAEGKGGREMLLEACKKAYRKHSLGDDSVGWDALAEELAAVLADEMGDEEFNRWVEEVSPGKKITD